MASTYSPSLRLELMATGDQSGTWGDTTNTNLGTLLEQAITGVLSVAEGDTTLTLTTVNGGSDQARNAVINLTGAMTANRDVVVQTANKLYLVKNSTTGGFSVVVKTAAGTGVTIPPGSSQWVYSDGTNVVAGLIGNMPFNNLLEGYTTTATAAGTTVLTVSSTHTQYFTGSTTQTVTLPVTSTLVLGQEFEIVNLSSGAVTVNSSGANLVSTVAAGASVRVQCILTSGTSAASWNVISANLSAYLPLAGGTMTGQLINTGSSVGYTPIQLISTEAAAAAGPIIELYRNSASPAANDILGQAIFYGQDSGPAKQEYASIQAVIVSATAASEASTLDFYTQKGGTRTLGLSLAGSVANSPSFAAGYTTTATAAGTTTLTVSSNQQQYFTGTSTQTIVLPVTSTLVLGQSYRIVNNSTGGALTVNSSGGNAVVVIPQGSTAVVTCILTSGTTAASWDAKTGPNGGLALLTSGAISSVATLDLVLTSYTSYRGIVIELSNIVAATDNTSLEMRFSTNGGSSYDAGASDYGYAINATGSTGNTASGTESASFILLAGNVGNAATTDGSNTVITLLDQTNTGAQTKIFFSGVTSDINSHIASYTGAGKRNTNQDTDAVRFLMSSGNIASGTYAVYGYL